MTRWRRWAVSGRCRRGWRRAVAQEVGEERDEATGGEVLEVGRHERGELVLGPPAQLHQVLGGELLAAQPRRRLERRGADQEEAVVLTVPPPVDERDDVGAHPHQGADRDGLEAELLVDLPAQGDLEILVGLDPAARRAPHVHRRPLARELPAHQQDPVVGVEHDGPGGLTDPQFAVSHPGCRAARR